MALSLALVLAGCSGGLTGLGGTGGVANLSPQPARHDGAYDAREAALGAREHPEVVAAFGGAYADPQLQAYLDRTIQRLRPASDRPDYGYRVTILNSPSINAFSLPGGYIYVTRGLLALANDSAEVAAVLAHEMAHVTARHAIEREQKAANAAVVSQVVNDMVGDPEAGAAAVAQTRGALAQFSRQQELAADEIGIRTMAKAGYDPDGAVTFLRALERQVSLQSKILNQEREAGRVDIFSSHPATPQRILAAEAGARAMAAAYRGERDRDGYLRTLQGLAYGDDPKEGFVRDRTFIHPGLGITFSVPEGYALENTPSAVVGFSPGGDIIRFDAVSVAREVSLETYLKQDAVRGGDVSEVTPVTIGGLSAATAIVRSDDWEFAVAAIRGNGTDVYRFILASRQLHDGLRRELAQSAGSFRLISSQEARAVRPQRVEIVQARPGDSVGSLAARMDFSDHREDRFRALNGLSPGDRVQPGQLVKIVAR
ncbi:M48 family metalloprotease [Lutibaculum baratangense]|uniref:Putative Zn-dependent protease n=1 Tax=Lutibaculum baratangense AMV1 TaxID=631454 RepID=V4QWK0_9HYPH|nr:M48 family metalloprotease [Lutibaculum baratangense]ESR24122.1 putative Zn-dependent protease [Lutibaculum baratangense AMV1]